MYGDLDNLIFLDIFSNDILAGIDESMIIEGKYLTKKDFIKNIFFMLNDEKFKPYSLVSRCEELQNTKKAVIKPKNYTKEVKYFYFKLLDNEMKKQAVLK